MKYTQSIIKILPAISLVLLAGCTPKHHVYKAHPVVVKKYVQQLDDQSVMYWYFVLNDDVYYSYSSRTPINTFTNITFNRTMTTKQVEEIENESKEDGQEVLQGEENLPTPEQMDGMTNEGGLATPETNSDTVAPAEGSSPSDSGSTSSDSGSSSSSD